MVALKKLILEKYPSFFNELDENLKIFSKEIKKELRDEGHVVIGMTGYPGKGKSNAAAIIGMLIDDDYDLDINICFIPTSKQIEETYMSLNKFSFFHIDEASRGLHKHKWHDAVQQKLNELYDTEREGHFLCTMLIMPRFQNFTENFRNFMITYWIDIPRKGIAVFYKKDEDKDIKDPWHMDESYKSKQKRWRGKRVFERTIGEKIRIEQITDCYWFYSPIPAIPKDIWELYQVKKKESRIKPKEDLDIKETYREKVGRERMERWSKITEMKNKGLNNNQIAVAMGISIDTLKRNLMQIRAWNEMRQGEGKVVELPNNYINKYKPNKKNEIPSEFNNI